MKNNKLIICAALLFCFCFNNNVNGSEELTKEEKVIAITILAEARSEGPDGMCGVAAVIKQRSINRNISPEKVCLQNKQFSCFNNRGVSDLEYLLKIKNKKVLNCAIWLVKNIDKIDCSKIGNADHYYANYIKSPYWAKGKKPVAKIGKHIFFKLN